MKHVQDCPACASRYTVHVQAVVGQRSGRPLPQYVCLDCRSFFNHSGYRETLQQQKDDFDFLHALQSTIYPNQSQLCLELITRLPHVKTICEIGYGLGWFLRAVNDYGRTGYGFDTNPYGHEFATATLGLNCANGMFDLSHQTRYDMFVSIMVFEHLEQPRNVFAMMRDRLNADGAIYLCVPFVERRDWPYLWTADSSPGTMPPDPFYDNDVHVMHYSIEGLRQLGLTQGARSAEYFMSNDVVSRSPGCYQGVLYRF